LKLIEGTEISDESEVKSNGTIDEGNPKSQLKKRSRDEIISYTHKETQ
jgi:hypothetical protein